jgi:hypothetical protein
MYNVARHQDQLVRESDGSDLKVGLELDDVTVDLAADPVL